MRKKKYHSPLAEVQEFDLKDIIMNPNSGGFEGENEQTSEEIEGGEPEE